MFKRCSEACARSWSGTEHRTRLEERALLPPDKDLDKASGSWAEQRSKLQYVTERSIITQNRKKGERHPAINNRIESQEHKINLLRM